MAITLEDVADDALPPQPLVHESAGVEAFMDIVAGLSLWRLWLQLGWNDILQRYRRSVLGPLWLTASMAIMVVALGVLYAGLFKQRIDEFLPFFCVGLLVWSLISSFLNEAGTLFTGSESYIKQISLPFSVYVYRSSWSKVIIFAHNFLIYFAVLLYFEIWPGAVGLLSIPGLMIVVFNGAVSSLCIGIISSRFRDVPQLISSAVQIIFFVTPIFWTPDSLKGNSFVIDFNPFYHLIEIVRAPLLGNFPSAESYLAVSIITLLNLAVSSVFFVKYRSRIAYWV